MSLVVPLEEIFANKEGLLASHPTWTRTELENVCHIINGYPFKSALFNRDKGCPVVRIRDISKNATETRYDGEVPKEALIDDGDMLIGMDGNFRCYEWNGGKAGLNQRVCKIVADERLINRKFLLFGINGYLKAIEDATSSVTVGHLSSRDILLIPFPLPPLPEQKRIVAKVEKLLEKVDASRAQLDKVAAILKRFRQSVLAAACSGRLTADWRSGKGKAGEWEHSSVGEVVESLKYGTATKCEYAKRGVPVLRIPNVVSGRIDHSDLKYAKLPAKELQQLRLVAGDILLIRSNGSVSLVGRTAVVSRAEEDYAYAGYLIRLRPDRKKVQPAFLNLVLSSYDIRLQIEVESRSTSGVNNINSEEVRELSFQLPALPEQREIVRRVEDLFALADRLEARVGKARGQVDKLTQSILAKAFQGELVPQDPNDEPAEKLLAHIRSTTGPIAAKGGRVATSVSVRRGRPRKVR